MTLEEIERSRPDTISVVEAGQRLGLSREAAYKAAKSGRIPTIRVEDVRRVPLAALASRR